MESLPDTTAAPFGVYAPDALARFVVGTDNFDRVHRPWALRRKLGKLWLRRSRRIFDLTFLGFKLRLHPATNAGDMGIVLNGIHGEEDEFARVAERIGDYENFIDIGANIGLYSLIAARGLPPGRPILAFEPAPDTALRLRANLAFNAGTERVEVIEAALGDQPGDLTLARGGSNIGGTSAVKPGGAGEQIHVRCLRLPDVLAARGIARIGMLKIDIEGFEDRALLPVLDVMPPEAWPRYILIEVCHSRYWKRDVVAELKTRGYREVYRNSRNIHFAREEAVS